MEVAASLLTLVQAAAVLISATRQLSRKLRSAPEELHALTAQLLVVQSELKRIKEATGRTHEELMTDELRQAISDAFLLARTGLSELDDVVDRAHGNRQIRDRVRWLRKEQKLAEKGLSKIKSACGSLLVLMQVISW